MSLVRSWCCHCYRWIETKHPPGNIRSWSASQDFSQKTYDISKPYLVSEVSIVPFNGVNLHTPQQYQIKTPTRRANIYKTWTGHLERPVRVAVHQSISKGFGNPNEKNLKEPKKNLVYRTEMHGWLSLLWFPICCGEQMNTRMKHTEGHALLPGTETRFHTSEQHHQAFEFCRPNLLDILYRVWTTHKVLRLLSSASNLEVLLPSKSVHPSSSWYRAP